MISITSAITAFVKFTFVVKSLIDQCEDFALIFFVIKIGLQQMDYYFFQNSMNYIYELVNISVLKCQKFIAHF